MTDDRDPKYLHSAARNRRYPEAAPRPMTGIWSTLTKAQRKAVLEYDGPITMGDPAMLRQPLPPLVIERSEG